MNYTTANESIDSTLPSATCIIADTVTQLNTRGVLYYTWTPIYFALTFSTRIICLVAFCVQAKSESLYLYQIFITLAETFESVAFASCSISKHLLSGAAGASQIWYRRCYICMWYDAHLANPSQMGGMLWCLTLSVCMTCDRIYALAKPISYAKNRYQKLTEWLVFLFSFVFMMCFTIYICFYLEVYYDPDIQDLYRIGPTSEWYKQSISKFIQVHTCMKLALTIFLVVLDIILCFIFRYRMTEKAAFAGSSRGQREKLAEQKKAKTFFQLTLIQSLLNIVAISGVFAYNFINFLPPSPLMDCLATILGLTADMTRQITETAIFFVLFSFSKSFRAIVTKGIRAIFGINKTAVVSLTGTTSTGGKVS